MASNETSKYKLSVIEGTEYKLSIVDGTELQLSLNGATGPTGPANVLEIGTVTTGETNTPAAASITGSSPTQTLNLTLPKGNTGATGPQGVQGIQGIQGPAGVTTYNDLTDKPNLASGRTIYVDSSIGTDTRTGINKYSFSIPFATISAAVSASVVDDLVYVREGVYTISSQISLNGKGNIYFETGVLVTISTGVVAFSLTAAESKTINGFASYVVNGSNTGIISQSNSAVQITFVCEGITGSTTGRLFDISAGIFFIRFYEIVTTNATGFYMTGSGRLLANIGCYSISCSQVIYSNTTGSINYDIWSVVGNSANGTIQILNCDGYSTRGVNLNNSANGPCLNLAFTTSGPIIVLRNFRMSTGGTGVVINTSTATRDLYMDQIKINASGVGSYSLSANNPITVYATTLYSNVLPDNNVTVSGQYNIMTNLF